MWKKRNKKKNEMQAAEYLERLINRNFTNKDIWITLAFDEEHLPQDGDIDAAIKIIQKYFRRINYQRRKLGLGNAKYVYVIEYDPYAKTCWRYHIVMDGAMDMDTVEKCWKQGSRSEVRRNGLSGLANYIDSGDNKGNHFPMDGMCIIIERK